MPSIQNAIGAHELTDKKSGLWRALLAELVGTLMINFFGCGAAITGNIVAVSLSFGLTVAAAVQAVGHVSGGHINPAVTFGLLSVGKIPLIRALLYVIAQSIGAIAGTAILLALSPDDKNLGEVMLKNDTTPVQGLLVEFMLAFILVFVVCGACDPGKPEAKSLAPLIIGLAVTVGHIVGIPRTNTGMNPARALGTAVIKGMYDDHWLYWVGPILGGVTAALLYKALGSAKLTERSYTTVATEEKEEPSIAVGAGNFKNAMTTKLFFGK